MQRFSSYGAKMKPTTDNSKTINPLLFKKGEGGIKSTKEFDMFAWERLGKIVTLQCEFDKHGGNDFWFFRLFEHAGLPYKNMLNSSDSFLCRCCQHNVRRELNAC